MHTKKVKLKRSLIYIIRYIPELKVNDKISLNFIDAS